MPEKEQSNKRQRLQTFARNCLELVTPGPILVNRAARERRNPQSQVEGVFLFAVIRDMALATADTFIAGNFVHNAPRPATPETWITTGVLLTIFLATIIDARLTLNTARRTLEN